MSGDLFIFPFFFSLPPLVQSEQIRCVGLYDCENRMSNQLRGLLIKETKKKSYFTAPPPQVFRLTGQGRRPGSKPRWQQLKAGVLLTMCSGLARWKMRRTREHMCSQGPPSVAAAQIFHFSLQLRATPPCPSSNERWEKEYLNNFNRFPFYFSLI